MSTLKVSLTGRRGGGKERGEGGGGAWRGVAWLSACGVVSGVGWWCGGGGGSIDIEKHTRVSPGAHRPCI